MKKERYFEPEIEITKFITEDVMIESLPVEPYNDETIEDNYPIFNVHD